MYQDLIYIDSDFTLTGTIISIPRKHASYWTIQWENNSTTTKIQNNSLQSYVMMCDNIMAECSFDAQRRYDSLHPEGKHKQNLKRCLTMAHHDTHESVMEQIVKQIQKSV